MTSENTKGFPVEREGRKEENIRFMVRESFIERFALSPPGLMDALVAQWVGSGREGTDCI